MSILAERRQKKQWILNPKKTEWSEDSNKFGQKMLEKMGWTPGKGLGVNEQGMVNALRIKYKNDLKGLGCENKSDDWIKTQEEFNTLLGELGGESLEADRIGEKSLEDISRNIKNRVHYHKFTRGKDLSKYSARDLESILGINSVSNKVKQVNDISFEEEKYEYKNFKNYDLLYFTNEKCSRNNALSDIKIKKIKRKKFKNTEEELSLGQCEEENSSYTNDMDSHNSYVSKKKKKKKKEKKRNLQLSTNDD